jgi:hypothetical protein
MGVKEKRRAVAGDVAERTVHCGRSLLTEEFSMDDINRISRVEFVPEGTRTADLPRRKKAGKLKPPGIDTDEDGFHLQPEPIRSGEESGDTRLDFEA